MLAHLSSRPLWVSASGSLLEFLRPRSMTAVSQSVPAFLLASTSVGPRASGEVASGTPCCNFFAKGGRSRQEDVALGHETIGAQRLDFPLL